MHGVSSSMAGAFGHCSPSGWSVLSRSPGPRSKLTGGQNASQASLTVMPAKLVRGLREFELRSDAATACRRSWTMTALQEPRWLPDREVVHNGFVRNTLK